ncbi:MAG: CPBP family intramembrane metalloprotease [Anaerolineae bacterium]|nr:CPBP family intramembrane metalloprotease [Anaerolineae bacterium]
MQPTIKRYPALSFLVIISLWNRIYMAGFTALVPIDPVQGPTIAHVALVFLFASPSVLGILMTRALDGREGLRALFSRAVRWRVNPLWYAAALLICPAVVGLSYVAQGLLGGPLAPIDLGAKLVMAIPIALVASIMEEFGWRGFALPRLQRRYSAVVSTLIVGLGWAAWHAPINYLVAVNYGPQALPMMLLLAADVLPISLIMTWIHNNAQQSMLLMVLSHFAITGSSIVFGLTNATPGDEVRNYLVITAIRVLVAIAIIVATGPKRLVRESRFAQHA